MKKFNIFELYGKVHDSKVDAPKPKRNIFSPISTRRREAVIVDGKFSIEESLKSVYYPPKKEMITEGKKKVNEASVEGREKYKDIRFNILHQVPRDYYIKGLSPEAKKLFDMRKPSYFKSYHEALKYAKLQIDDFLSEAVTGKKSIQEASVEGREKYKDVRFHIIHQPPKGYFVKAVDVDSRAALGRKIRFFDKYDDAVEHAELEIDGYLEESITEATGDKKEIKIDGQKWYLEKIDSTHFYLSNTSKGRGMSHWAHHIGQHKGESYYDEVRSWLKK